MNTETQIYWDEFWKGREPHKIDAWKFGVIPDELAEMVISRKKTTTTSTYAGYEARNEPIPISGKCSVILNNQDKPVAIIKTIDVQVMPMNEVPIEHMADEGDCGLQGELWWDIHKEYFTNILAQIGKEFSEDMTVVCERFELIDVKQ